MHLETDRLVLRDIEEDDAEALADLWTDPDVTMFMGGPRDYDNMISVFEQDAAASDNELRIYDLWPLVEKSSGQVIGHCGLSDKDVEGELEIELVVVLARQAWGKGYATEISRALLDFAFETAGLERVIALIDPQNETSQHMALKVGMEFERQVTRPGGTVRDLYAIMRPPAAEEE
jgi:RimJ/RimL family protein N-acetyltransferase